MGKVMAVVNQKGELGKTTTTVNRCCLAMQGQKILVVDIDPREMPPVGWGR